MNRLFALLMPLAILLSCTSEPKPEVNSEDAVNDALISFNYNAQGGRFSEAIAFITYRDQMKLIDANGNVKEEYKLAMKRIKLSSLQKNHFMLDSKGALEGMVAVLDEANRKALTSDEQRSLGVKEDTNTVALPVKQAASKPETAKTTPADIVSTPSDSAALPSENPQ